MVVMGLSNMAAQIRNVHNKRNKFNLAATFLFVGKFVECVTGSFVVVSLNSLQKVQLVLQVQTTCNPADETLNIIHT